MSFTGTSSDRAILFNGWQSYQTVQEFEAQLQKTGLKPTSKTDKKGLADGDKRPPFDFAYITFADFQHLGCDTKVDVVFFNNRLMEVIVYPKDPNRYLAELAKLNIQFDKGGMFRGSHYTLVETHVDIRQDTYVRWTDARLKEELLDWISKYS